MKRNKGDVSPRYLFDMSESFCTCVDTRNRPIFIGQKEKQRCDFVVT